MRNLLVILAALLLCASTHAQTVKALSYGTNGRFITGTNALTFSNQINFAGGDFEIETSGLIRWQGQDRIELETYTLLGDWTFTEPEYVRGQLGFLTNLNTLWTATNATAAARALSGSTNTNHPFSGSVSVVGTNNTNTLVFSNGILQSVQ
jgi:hypothetical protein